MAHIGTPTLEVKLDVKELRAQLAVLSAAAAQFAAACTALTAALAEVEAMHEETG
jgi:hypothetical protein